MTRRCIAIVAAMVLTVSVHVTYAQSANDIVLYATDFSTVRGTGRSARAAAALAARAWRRMRPNFIDSWGVLNATRGFTCSTPNPTMKLDYWLMDQSGRITPNWSWVVTWPGTTSDHFPVHKSFTVR